MPQDNIVSFDRLAPKWAERFKTLGLPGIKKDKALFGELHNCSSCVVGEAYGFRFHKGDYEGYWSDDSLNLCNECVLLGFEFLAAVDRNEPKRLAKAKSWLEEHWNEKHSTQNKEESRS